MSAGDNGSISFDSGSLGDTGNSYGFTLGNASSSIDPNSGLNSLPSSLVGPMAGSIPNGFTNAFSNYSPDSSGISAGALNGNTSFAMPGVSSSMAQMLSQALGAGAKVAQPGQNPKLPGARGAIVLPAESFNAPMVDFAGSQSGSNAGNALLQLLAKYTPGQK